MLLNNLKNYDLILASASPRRQQLLEAMGISFRVVSREVDEIFPEHMNPLQVAEYLSRIKAGAFTHEEITDRSLIIAADTVVTLDGDILGKPANIAEAVGMLRLLSGKTHEVITGVTLYSLKKVHTFSVKTRVSFRVLQNDEINYSVNTFKPFDKAGGYGIQEWIGYVGVERITGSYVNVVGLPTQRLYAELSKF